MIKSTLFILFFLKYLIHVSSLSTNDHIQKILLAPLELASAIHIFFKLWHSRFMIFHDKIGILGEYLYVSHTLFILYLESNHTLFGEKNLLYLEI